MYSKYIYLFMVFNNKYDVTFIKLNIINDIIATQSLKRAK